MRSLPLRFNPKVSTIEELKDIQNLKMDELHGIITTYEMRTWKEKSGLKEATFKTLKRRRRPKGYDHSNLEADEE